MVLYTVPGNTYHTGDKMTHLERISRESAKRRSMRLGEVLNQIF